MIAKTVYCVCVKMKGFDFGENRTHIKSSVTSRSKHFLKMPEKYANRVRIVFVA